PAGAAEVSGGSLDEDGVDRAVLAGAARDPRLSGAGLHDGALGHDVAAHVVDVRRVARHGGDLRGRGLPRLGVGHVGRVRLEHAHAHLARADADVLALRRADGRENGLAADLELALLVGHHPAAAGGLALGFALPNRHADTDPEGAAIPVPLFEYFPGGGSSAT